MLSVFLPVLRAVPPFNRVEGAKVQTHRPVALPLRGHDAAGGDLSFDLHA